MISIPFIYLGLSVLSSATESQFLICRYDPFVGIFRLDAPYTMIIFGSLLLIAGVFINRPYCRYLCPYGVLLNIFSRFSHRHLTITPANAPIAGYVRMFVRTMPLIPSDIVRPVEEPQKERKRFLIYLLLVPLFAVGGAVLFRKPLPCLRRT